MKKGDTVKLACRGDEQYQCDVEPSTVPRIKLLYYRITVWAENEHLVPQQQ
jgi:hypothetical protein